MLANDLITTINTPNAKNKRYMVKKSNLVKCGSIAQNPWESRAFLAHLGQFGYVPRSALAVGNSLDHATTTAAIIVTIVIIIITINIAIIGVAITTFIIVIIIIINVIIIIIK